MDRSLRTEAVPDAPGVVTNIVEGELVYRTLNLGEGLVAEITCPSDHVPTVGDGVVNGMTRSPTSKSLLMELLVTESLGIVHCRNVLAGTT